MTTDHSKSYFLDFWHHCAISSYVVVSGNNVEIMCLCRFSLLLKCTTFQTQGAGPQGQQGAGGRRETEPRPWSWSCVRRGRLTQQQVTDSNQTLLLLCMD